MTKQTTADLKLRERVKELKCLYALTRYALEVDNDIDALMRHMLSLLPAAMQYPALAEVTVRAGSSHYQSKDFDKCITRITAAVVLPAKGARPYGTIVIGYRPEKSGRTKKSAGAQNDLVFLSEEKSLLNTVARELALFINKVQIAERSKKLELQLQHSERLAFVGELSAGIAHELNEPLGKILGFAQLIRKNGALQGEPADDIERIIKASLYTREIIKKLMLFSRQMPRQVTAIDVNAIIGNILYFIDVRFQDSRISVVRKLDPKLPEIQADPVQLSQVLVNLITNAVHAMPQGGQITITTRFNAQAVTLSVADSGHGMGAEIRKRIFEPFFTTKPVGQGTGLGLSVVQGIIEDHKGKINVTSAVGKGTRFDVVLPRRGQSGQGKSI